MNPEEKEIQEAMDQLHTHAPAELKQRLQALASSSTVRKPSPWPARLALAGACAAAVGVIAIMLAPTVATAKTFDMVVDATRQAHTFSFEATSRFAGRTKQMWAAFSPGKVVMRSAPDKVMLMESGTMKMYDAPSNRVFVMKMGNSPETQSPLQSFVGNMETMDLRKMLEDWRRQYPSQNTTVGPIVQHNGRRFYNVTLLQPGKERIRLTTDAETDLPTHVVRDTAEGSKWNTDMEMEIRYGDNVDRSLLDFSVPKDAKVSEVDFATMMGGMGTGANVKGNAFIRERIRQMMESWMKP